MAVAGSIYAVLFIPCALLLVGGREVPLDDICVNCICEATSGCDSTSPSAECDGDTCGMYALPKVFWEDGGKLLVVGDDGSDEDSSYKECARNARCAEAIVHNYMVKYSQDCNGDGDVDCYDYAAIHRKGGFGCRATLDQPYRLSIEKCIQAAKNLSVPDAAAAAAN